jgi:hypothetical protein
MVIANNPVGSIINIDTLLVHCRGGLCGTADGMSSFQLSGKERLYPAYASISTIQA